MNLWVRKNNYNKKQTVSLHHARVKKIQTVWISSFSLCRKWYYKFIINEEEMKDYTANKS